MTHIYMTYVGEPQSEVRKALNESGYLWVPVELDPADDQAYWKFHKRQWEIGESYLNVEQDIVVDREVLDTILHCHSMWCAATYPYFVGGYAGMGCMKFTAELMTFRPDTLDLAGQQPMGPEHPPRHWCSLDSALQTTLQRGGIPLCRHSFPQIRHLRPYEGLPQPTHACGGRRPA